MFLVVMVAGIVAVVLFNASPSNNHGDVSHGLKAAPATQPGPGSRGPKLEGMPTANENRPDGAHAEPGRMRVVVTQDGKPVPDLEVRIWHRAGAWNWREWSRGTTDSKGVMSAPWTDVELLEFTSNRAGLRFSAERRLDETSASRSVTWQLSAHPCQVVRGRLLDAETREPIGGAIVYTLERELTESGSDGRFALAVESPIDHGAFTVRAAGYWDRESSLGPFIKQADGSGVLLLRACTGVHGHVTHSDGSSVAGATIAVFRAGDVPQSVEDVRRRLQADRWVPHPLPGQNLMRRLQRRAVQAVGSPLRTTQADHAGQYRIDRLRPGGRYQLVAWDEKRERFARSEPFHAPDARETRRVDLHLASSPLVSLVVMESDGRPTGEPIYIFCASLAHGFSSYVAEDTHVPLHLPPAPCVIWAANTTRVSEATFLDPRESRPGALHVRLHPLTHFEAQIVDTDGTPLAGARVSRARFGPGAPDMTWIRPPARSDEHGNVHWPSSPGAAYLLLASHTQKDGRVLTSGIVPASTSDNAAVVSLGLRGDSSVVFRLAVPENARMPETVRIVFVEGARQYESGSEVRTGDIGVDADGIVRHNTHGRTYGVCYLKADGFAVARASIPADAYRADASPVEVRLEKEQRVRLLVREVGGRALPLARAREERARWWHKANKEGWVTVHDLTKTGGQVQVSAPGYETARVRVNLDRNASRTVSLRRAAAIAGRVLDMPAGLAVLRPRVYLTLEGADGPAREAGVTTAVVATRLQAHGTFRAACGAGVWRVEVELPSTEAGGGRRADLGRWRINGPSPAYREFAWPE